MSYYPDMQGDFAFLLLGLLPFGIWLFMLVAAVAVYVLRSLGLYKMARNTAMLSPWLAFVPIAHEYLAAKMADRGNAACGKRTKYSLWVLIGSIIMLAAGVSMMIQTLLMIFGSSLQGTRSAGIAVAMPLSLFFICYILLIISSIAVRIIQAVANYYLYYDFEPENAVLYTVLSVFGLDVICKMIIKDNVPVSIAGRYAFHQPKYKA